MGLGWRVLNMAWGVYLVWAFSSAPGEESPAFLISLLDVGQKGKRESSLKAVPAESDINNGAFCYRLPVTSDNILHAQIQLMRSKINKMMKPPNYFKGKYHILSSEEISWELKMIIHHRSKNRTLKWNDFVTQTKENGALLGFAVVSSWGP